MNRPLVLIAGAVGIFLLIAAFVYFTTPANSLPSFFPGHDAALSKTHYKHGVGTLFLGLLALAFAWFQSGGKSSK